jgi:hypothetical protein
MRPARIIPAAALTLVAIIVAAAFAWPVVRHRAFYADAPGTIHQPTWRARPRTILWQPAAPVAALNTPADEYEPRVSREGQTLFFVRGRAGHNAEIYTCTRTAQGWSAPVPLPINSPADDLGPEPLPEGAGLLFYSDREGGLGGYDLWLAERSGESWSPPVNLGALVNSRFNEYSPALTPDRRTLYFASNRPRPGESPDRGGPAWPATLRENAASHDYDLFAADFAGGAPGPARALLELNTPASEGAPAVSPAGDFLYFSSDRPGGLGGFDLYRSRLHAGTHEKPTNLGEPINSAYQELDPALSLAGFALDFSSDRPLAAAEPAAEYNLFHSESREVAIEHEARPIDWAGLWSAAAPWLLALLLLAALLLLLRLSRNVLRSTRLSTLAKCLIGSVFAHILLLLLLSLWGVTNSIGELFHKPGGGAAVHLTSADPAAGALAMQVRGELTSPAMPQPETPGPIASLALGPAAPQDTAPPNLPTPLLRASPVLTHAPADAPPDQPAPALNLVDAPAQTQDLPSPEAPAAAATTERHAASADPRSPAPVAAVMIPAPSAGPAPALPSTALAAAAAPLASLHAAPSSPAAPPKLALLEQPAPAPSPLPLAAPSAPAPSGGTTEPSADQPTPATEPAATLPLSLPQGSASSPMPGRSELAPAPATIPLNLSDSAPDAPAPGLSLTPGEPVMAAAAPTTELSVPGEASRPASAAAEEHAPGIGLAPVPEPGAAALPPVTSSAGDPVLPMPGAADARPAVAKMHIREATAQPQRGPHLSITAEPAQLPLNLKLPPEGSPAPDQEPAPEAAAGAPRATPLTVDGTHGPDLALPTGALDLPEPKAPEIARADAPAIELDLRPRDSAAPSSAWTLTEPPLPAAAATELKLPDELPPVDNPYAQRAPELREKLLQQRGGDDETEAAVKRSLSWLARHQSASGKWDAKDFDDDCGECDGAASVDGDVAVTGLALLCFFGSDHTHLKDGPYRENVSKALAWLLRHQSESGDLRSGESMYTHAIATIALAEAYAMTRDPRLAEPVRSAVRFIAAARSPRGGWRYDPGQFGDTSVLGWQVMAMVSARRAGIEVSDAELEAAAHWLDRVSPRPGVYAYQPDQAPTASMTAEGWFCRQLLGDPRESPRAAGSREFLAEVTPRWGRRSTTYLWYYATLAYFQNGGEEWDRWNAALKEQLLAHQERDGAAAGSWRPADRWSTSGGRVYQTAICTLTLEVYYRYLPMYARAQPPAPARP